MYQSPTCHTKTNRLPKVVPLPWSEPRGAVVSRARTRWASPLVVLEYDGERLGQREQMYLGSVSPLFTPERHRWTRELRREVCRLATLELRGEQWWLLPEPGARFALDGTWVTKAVSLAGAGVIDVAPETSAAFSFGLRAGEASLDFGVGPLWVPTCEGHFTFEDTPKGWHGVLRANCLGLDSLTWLRRIMRSPVERRLASLELHLHTNDETVDWESFVSEHRATARLAAFEVRLKGARPPGIGPTPRLTPHALLPSENWRVVPLQFLDGLWTLRRGAHLLRWEERDAALYERLPSGALLSEPARWHRRPSRGPECLVVLPDDFVLLPGPSTFLSSQRLLPDGPLTPTLVSVFADVLAAEGDAAAALLLASANGDAASIEALWQPYVATAGPTPRPVFEGEHCCGFFEAVTVRVWSGFARDVPILLQHPMLQRLRLLQLVGPIDLAAFDAAVLVCRIRGVTLAHQELPTTQTP